MAQFKNTTIDATGSLELPAGTTSQRPSSPLEGMIRYNTTLSETEYYDGSAWRLLSDTNPEATGGLISDTEIGGIDYRIHTFTNTGNTTFTVTKGGEIDYLIVAGGGAGGGGLGGGGGGGGVIMGSTTVTPQAYTITVGAGGLGDDKDANNGGGQSGGNSIAFGLTALGGGVGGQHRETNTPVADGGSGGGSANEPRTGRTSGGLATQPTSPSGGYGHNGGAAAQGGNNFNGAGGGGAGGPGETTPNDGWAGGLGGPGIISYIDGKPTVYAAGGGGGVTGRSGTQGQGGDGGSGGGGGGAADTQPDGHNGYNGRSRGNTPSISQGGDAGPNTGSGGGGGGWVDEGGSYDRGGNGGSGIVIVRYRKNKTTTTSPTVITRSTFPSSNPFTPTSPAESARQITDLGYGNGWYWVNLAGPRLVYVDTQFNGGGWYLIMQNGGGRGGVGGLTYVDATSYKQIYRTQFSNFIYDNRYPLEFEEFNLWTGMRLWQTMTGGPETGGEIAQIVHSYPTDLSGAFTKRATWSYTDFGAQYGFIGAANVSSTSDDPGLYSSHAVPGNNLTTTDRDQDVYSANCANLYNGNPWWYTACWSGNYFAGGGYSDRPYWRGSGADNHAFGQIYVRATT